MYNKRASARQLKQWIVTYISNTDNTFSRKKGKQSRALKVIRHISGPSCDGVITKHCTDGEVFIRTLFTTEAMKSFFADLDDADSQIDWGNALLILQDCSIHLYDKEYVLQVDRFRLWDLQEGFRRKNTLIYCMHDDRVYRKMLEEVEFRRKEQEQVVSGDNSREESLRLTQLLEEIGQASQECPVAVGKSGETTGLLQTEQETRDVPLLPPGETAGNPDVKRCLMELLVTPFTVQEFLVSTSESEQLKQIKEWRDDYHPSSLLCQGTENQMTAGSMETMAEEEQKKNKQESDIQEREAICSNRSLPVTCQKMSNIQSIISQSPKTDLMVNSPKVESHKKILSTSDRTDQEINGEEIMGKEKPYSSSQTSSNQNIMAGIYDSGLKDQNQSQTLQTSIWQNEVESVRLSCSESLLECQDHQINSHDPLLDTHEPCLDTHEPCLDTHEPCLDTHHPHLDNDSMSLDLASPSAHSTQREPLEQGDFSQNNLRPVSALHQTHRDTTTLMKSFSGNTGKIKSSGNTGKIKSLTCNSYLDEFHSFLSNEQSGRSRSHVTLRSPKLGKDVTSATRFADKTSLDKIVVQHKSVSGKLGNYNDTVLSDEEQSMYIQDRQDKHVKSGSVRTQTTDIIKLVNGAPPTDAIGDYIPSTLPFLTNVYPETQPFLPMLSPENDLNKEKLEDERLVSLADTSVPKLKSSVLLQLNGNESVKKKKESKEIESHRQTKDVTNEDKLETERLISLARPGFDDFTDNVLEFTSSKIESNNKLDSNLSLDRKLLHGKEKFDEVIRECGNKNDNMSPSVMKNVAKLKCRESDEIQVGCMNQSTHTKSQTVKRKLVLENQKEKISNRVEKKVKTDQISRAKQENSSLGKNLTLPSHPSSTSDSNVNLTLPSHPSSTSDSNVKRGGSAVLEKSSQTDIINTIHNYDMGTGKTRSCTFMKSSKSKETDNRSVENFESNHSPGGGRRLKSYQKNVMSVENQMLKGDSSLQRETMSNQMVKANSSLQRETMSNQLVKGDSSLQIETMSNQMVKGDSSLQRETMSNQMVKAKRSLQRETVSNQMLKGDSSLQREAMSNKMVKADSSLQRETMSNQMVKDDSSLQRETMSNQMLKGDSSLKRETMSNQMVKGDSSLQRETMQNASKTNSPIYSDGCNCRKELVRRWVAGNLRFVWETGKNHEKVLPSESPKNPEKSIACVKKLDKTDIKCSADDFHGKVNIDRIYVLRQGFEATVKPVPSVGEQPKSLSFKSRSCVTDDETTVLEADQASLVVDCEEEPSIIRSLQAQREVQNVQLKSQERISQNQTERQNIQFLRLLEPSEVSDIGKQLLQLRFPDEIRTAAIKFLLEET